MPDATTGRHTKARHRAPSRYELTRDRVCDSLLELPTPNLSLPSGRTLAVTAASGVLATGVVVGAQGVIGSNADDIAAAPLDASVSTVLARASVEDGVDRNLDRTPLAAEVTDPDALKKADAQAAKAEADRKAAIAKAEKARAEKKAAEKRARELASRDPRQVARSMLADHGWGDDQFTCLDALWAGESGWDASATNPSSGAYGIPQSLPASKMASAGADWQTNPATQIEWGLGYISQTYGTPCGANSFKQGNGWY